MQWPSAGSLKNLDPIQMRFCLLNAENLFLLFDQTPTTVADSLTEQEWQKLSSSLYENKPLRKTRELAKTITDIDPDIVMLCEVGGLESLKNFNELFLQSRYLPCLLEGNSNRNIDVGFLIKKTLPFYFDVHSNKNRSINFLYPHERDSLANGYPLKDGKTYQSHKFSRDVLELRLFNKDREKPFLMILLTHLKSRLDPEKIDPNGFERRHAELKTLIDIYQEVRKKYAEVPMIVCGDFNGNASSVNTDEEFRFLYENSDLQDVLELGAVDAFSRSTYYQIRNGGRVDGRQIDFAFLSEPAKKFLKPQSSLVYRYKNELGQAHDTPQSLEAKLLLPSDHYPVVFELTNLPVDGNTGSPVS